MRIYHEQVLGKNTRLELMPYAAHIETPQWDRCFPPVVSFFGIAAGAFCWIAVMVIDEVSKLVKSGSSKRWEGIFVTHL